MRVLISAIIFFAAATQLSAGQMTVDGSNKETYERSIKAMIEGLPEEDREVFGRGLAELIVTRYPAAQGAEGLAVLPFLAPAIEAAHITMDGVSREEILAKGREITASDAIKTNSDQQDAKSKDIVRACLQDKIVLTNAKIERHQYSGHTVSMGVTNNLPWAIAGLRGEYVITSDGRSVPWKKDSFVRSIDGGIEPGETRMIAFPASLEKEAPDELIVSATVLSVADSLERQLIKDNVIIVGWSEEESPLVCE